MTDYTELSIMQLIKKKHELIRALPHDDHARNFADWQALDDIDRELNEREN
jgi:hypothetical protein